MSTTVIVGAQWGDECKGKISAHIAKSQGINYVYRAGVGPNAEHGLFWREEGEYIKCNQLPLGFIRNPDSQIRIGPGTCVDPVKLFTEMKKFGIDSDRVKVDPRCPIVKPEYMEWERENLPDDSTYSGCGPCRSDFVRRKAVQARDLPELQDMLLDIPEEINRLAERDDVLIESSQGTLLSLALSYDYPHVTSDNVTTCAAMDDVGLDWRLLRNVVMVVKSMPTRESNGPMGNTEEISEEQLKIEGAMYEDSSIDGGKRRKVKGIDFDLLAYASKVNGPTEIALTFLDHFDPAMKNVLDKSKITEKTWRLIDKVERTTGAPVVYLETGKRYDSIMELQ
jgi:adenylosuccinate synthase